MNATDRGWGDPRSATFERDNIVLVKIGPFPKKGKLKSGHPEVKFRVHKDIAYLLQGAVTEAITVHGYRLDGPQLDDWGYICRPIRGYETKYRVTRSLRYLSNHSWGLAVDINSINNPMAAKGKPMRSDLSPPVIECFRRWGFSWGGDYTSRRDPMHWEVTLTRPAAQQKVKEIQAFFASLKKTA